MLKNLSKCIKQYPGVPIIVGGIYASLMPDQCKEYTGCDYVHTGILEEAEELIPDYNLVDVDYQIIHTTRGCIRRCKACGVYNIEPQFTSKSSIKNEIVKRRIIFYDNSLLANKYIKDILNELIELKNAKKISYCESQSGFDGRILMKNPDLGQMVKDAGFKNPKIAWDGALADSENIKKQIDILVDSGYKKSEISVFVLYNFEIDYYEMEGKRVKCWEWGVQVSDCRYRPLNIIKDNYNPAKKNGQGERDYYIHPNWTDSDVRLYRRNIRRHNICVRLGTKYHSSISERKKIPKEKAKIYRHMDYDEGKKYLNDAWNPAVPHKNQEMPYF
ncbi:MAG: hypothetical protein ACRCVG_00690 [Methanobacteriaceae archaeon]